MVLVVESSSAATSSSTTSCTLCRHYILSISWLQTTECWNHFVAQLELHVHHTQNTTSSILDDAFPRCLDTLLFLCFAMLCFALFKAGTNGCALILIGTVGSYTCIGVGVGCYFAMLCFVLFKAGTNGSALNRNDRFLHMHRHGCWVLFCYAVLCVV